MNGHPRHRRTLAPRAAASAIALALLALAGCVTRVQLAAPHAMLAAAPADTAVEPVGEGPAWPDRWGQESGKRGAIVPLEGPFALWQGVWLGEHHYLRAADTEYADAAALGEALGVPAGFKFRTEGPGSYIFVRDPRYAEPDPPPLPAPAADDPAILFKYISGEVRRRWENTPGIDLQRTWFALYDPLGRPADESRGTLVVLPGMFGTPVPMIESAIATWRKRGWSVLRMMSHPSRFTERLEIAVDPADPSGAAEALADALTDRAAECAYATEAAVRYARDERPELNTKPVVLVGMSGGAIALSTVHAWNPDLYDGAVIIAGGVNFLRINLESNYADFIDAIHLDWTPLEPGEGKPTREQLDRLCDAYLVDAPLDGWFLASSLVGKPVLMIHGSADRAVPAHLGEELWKRAGEPERWTLPVGHELVFLALPAQARNISKWLAEHVEHSPDSADESATESAAESAENPADEPGTTEVAP
ncbi:MAG: alpha/beta hydrolase [Phycisphaerales bacterium]